MKRIIMAACIVSLAACGGDKDDVATEQQQDWESRKQSLVYSFPDHQQQQVPVPSPVVLRFSSPVVETSPAVVLREVGGPIVTDFDMEWVDGKRGLIIKPDSKLKPMTEYVVQVPTIELEKGVAPARNIRFSTRALFEGPKSLVASDTFEVTRMIPDGENYQVMDFSSFRVQFSQPLDRTTVKYGNGADATVQLMGPAGLVDAHLLVSGHYMTIDPKEDLTPGAEYSLNMTTGITSTYGETLPGGSFGNPGDTLAVSVKVSPQDTKAPGTGLRVSMVQDVADTGELSPLTGQPINLVPMASVLLGEDTATQASGTVAAELAFVPNFPDATPFRVKRGSLIEGASIEVLIGGHVPAGFESGKVRMDFLSDAVGYLLPNPYSNSDDAPRQVRLFMDVAVSTETPSANGAITQDLLHIELVGTSIVEDGVMVINAVGVVEPDVLGSERATGVLSFYMKAYEDQDNPPQVAVDITAPVLQSWSHTPERMGVLRNTDPVVINFNEPIFFDGDERDAIIQTDDEDFKFSYYTDGASLILSPSNKFKHGINYKINLFNYIMDIHGNNIEDEYEIEFSFDSPVNTLEEELVQNTANGIIRTYEDIDVRHSPILLSTFPGFPCPLDPITTDINQGIAGRCLGAMKGWDMGTEFDRFPSVDLLPVLNHPENYPIITLFSKDIDPGTVVLGKTFIVHDKSGEDVAGDVIIEGKKVTFWPKTKWKVGENYSYTIKSNGDPFSAVAVCDGTESVCDVDGFPLKTQLWNIETNPYPGGDRDYITRYITFPEIAGGPEIVQYFKASESSVNIIQVLSNDSSDRNANFYLDKPASSKDEEMFETGFVIGASLYFNAVYGIAEKGAETQLTIVDAGDNYPGVDRPDIDPGGVVPPPNSAKLISLKKSSPFTLDDLITGRYSLSGLNVGCGYVGHEPHPDYFELVGKAIEAPACPREKFTYLTSAIVSEVTDEFVEGKGQKIILWPSQIMATSLKMISLGGFGGYGVLDSGPQVMRMRYSKDDPNCIESESSTCSRSNPIVGYIHEGAEGETVLSVELDLYVDAPQLNNSLRRAIGAIDTQLDLISYPITMKLSGKVDFMDDGSMVVEQYNTEDVFIDFMFASLGNNLNSAEIVIPAYGSRLVFQTESIR